MSFEAQYTIADWLRLIRFLKVKLAGEPVFEPPKQAHKFDSDKLRYDLFPPSLAEVAKVFTIGAKKYGDRNWEMGLSYGRVFGAMLRHAFAWWWGERSDPEDGQHHLSSVAWAALVLMHYENTDTGIDDRSSTL